MENDAFLFGPFRVESVDAASTRLDAHSRMLKGAHRQDIETPYAGDIVAKVYALAVRSVFHLRE